MFPGPLKRSTGTAGSSTTTSISPWGGKIVLFSHYVNAIIPGWFDKYLFHRGPDLKNLENVVVLCPTEEFVARLPYAKIPTRNDFMGFRGRNEQRKTYWKQVVGAAESLGEEFLTLMEGRWHRRENPTHINPGFVKETPVIKTAQWNYPALPGH